MQCYECPQITVAYGRRVHRRHSLLPCWIYVRTPSSRCKSAILCSRQSGAELKWTVDGVFHVLRLAMVFDAFVGLFACRLWLRDV